MILKVIKKLWLFSLFFMLNRSLSALAATKAPLAVLTPAQVQLEFKKFNKPNRLIGHFEQQKLVKDLDVTIKSSGQFEINRLTQDQVVLTWQIIQPDQLTVCIDDESVAFDNPRLKKKNRIKLAELSSEDSSGMTKMIHLMKMNPDLLIKDFKIVGSHPNFEIRPNDQKNYQFEKAVIELDEKKNLKNISLLELNKDSLQIRFSQTKESKLTSAQLKQKVCP